MNNPDSNDDDSENQESDLKFLGHYQTEVKILQFKNFDEFISYCGNLVQNFAPKLQFQKVREKFYVSERVHGSQGEKMQGTTFGEVIVEFKLDSVQAQIEFVKECDFEWYFGDPQGGALVIYHPLSGSLQMAPDFQRKVYQRLRSRND